MTVLPVLAWLSDVVVEPEPMRKLHRARQAAAAVLAAEHSPTGVFSNKTVEPHLKGSPEPEGTPPRSQAVSRSRRGLTPLPMDFSAFPVPQEIFPLVPGRPSHFQVVLPQDMPKRKSPRNSEGAAALFHALAQIELAAVEINCAQLLLYPHGPQGWQQDLATITLDECRHFELLAGILESWQVPFGSLPIHHALWDGFLQGTSWLEHLALTTRYQEANGVDASHLLLTQARKTPTPNRLAEVTPIIEELHHDEIRHVSLGSKWWHWAFDKGLVPASQRQRDEESCKLYFERIGACFAKPWSKRFPFYIEGRLKAGFTEAETQVFHLLRSQD